MVNFVRLLSEREGVSIKSIFSSSVQLSDGVIVKINDYYYRVNLSPDQNTYSLSKVGLISTEIVTIKN